MNTNVVTAEFLKELKEIFDKLKSYLHFEKVEENKSLEANSNLTILFHELLDKIDEAFGQTNTDSDDFIKLLAIKSSLLYEQAKLNFFSGTESDSLSKLQHTLKLIEDYSDNSRISFLYLRIINHLSYLYSKNGNLHDACQLLENIISKEYNSNILVYSTEDLFTNELLNEDISRYKFNKLVINNMQMLGWIYGKLGLHEKHIDMEHKALLKLIEIPDFDIFNFTLKCCRLVTMFLTKYNWCYARYHLSVLEAIIDKSNIEKANQKNEIAHSKAELARAWIHYGLHLYSASKKKMLELLYESDKEDIKNEEDEINEISPSHEFPNLEISLPNIPISFIVDTQNARTLFLHTQTWLKQMRSYYTLRDYPLQYVNAVLDLSELYRFLAFYETDLESQYNVQKRRCDALEALSTLLKEVRPSCYAAVSVELWRELAEVQVELMSINLKRLYTFEADEETPEGLKERIDAVSDIHNKLETVGDSLCSSNVEKIKTEEIRNIEDPEHNIELEGINKT